MENNELKASDYRRSGQQNGNCNRNQSVGKNNHKKYMPGYQSKNMNYVYNKEYFEGIFEGKLEEDKKEKLFKERGKQLTYFSYPVTVKAKTADKLDSGGTQPKVLDTQNVNKEQQKCCVPFVSNLIDNMETAYGKLKETSNGSLHENDNVNSEKMPDNAPDENAKLEKAFVQIKMKTTYPGLLIGLGYPHDSKERGAIAGGFSFDYTTGLPYIPGSTVKGMLRSYFPGQRTKNKEAYRKFIAQVLYASLGEPEGDVQWDIDKLEKYVDTLEELLFEEDNIYLGGYPLLDEKSDKKILAEEFITPHKPLKNPNVINILKVKPGVKFGFLFVLHACKLGDIPITVEQIKTFFEQILELGGVGAKTNVGYSQFELCKNEL